LNPQTVKRLELHAHTPGGAVATNKLNLIKLDKASSHVAVWIYNMLVHVRGLDKFFVLNNL
jgi:hypothetical protein